MSRLILVAASALVLGNAAGAEAAEAGQDRFPTEVLETKPAGPAAGRAAAAEAVLPPIDFLTTGEVEAIGTAAPAQTPTFDPSSLPADTDAAHEPAAAGSTGHAEPAPASDAAEATGHGTPPAADAAQPAAAEHGASDAGHAEAAGTGHAAATADPTHADPAEAAVAAPAHSAAPAAAASAPAESAGHGAPEAEALPADGTEADAGHAAPVDGQAATEAGHEAAAGAEGGEPASHEGDAAEHAPPEEGAAPPDSWATTRIPMPYDIIRTIQFLQDQVSRGNGRAIQVQAMLLRRFGPVLADAESSVWEDRRNTRAAVLFVLSGGPPDILKRLLARGVIDPADEPMFKAAIAYVDNDLSEAQTLLSGVDFDGMEPGLAAHLHLVLGQLQQLKQPKDAVKNLDRARLLAPGGLIEEAALRMEVMLVDGLGDHEEADRLARQYFDRYSASSYSANFEARFASVFAGRGETDAAAAFATMLDVTRRLADANKRAIYLAVARRALVAGNREFAKLAADAARGTEGISEPENQRALLYAAAARIGSESATEVAAGLGAVDRALLHPEDVKLLDAADSVLGGIDRLPVADADDTSDQVADSSPLFDRAQQLLSQVDSDLGKAQQ